ncbi:glutathione S-transferase family protein [Jannaschia sp. M317]|uniref:glutathione S-transferase family protein n=1 Tax=Jannaschia sp. M317 TaxID=2867011 RepID=UPI0021A3C7BD|nr:glutathione S-transferase family protein [Jannaschia sp. M317]UWQ18889.1 glutathione S-transferase family protein [Jannaschia sp. M317]
MGQLVEGVWHDDWYNTEKHGGKFVRPNAAFRNWVTADGSPGPTGEGGYPAEAGRYHLYVSLACPWAHRALIMRSLKGLTDLIDISVVHPDMLGDGWTFETDDHGATGDRLYGLPFMRDIYIKAKPDVTGRVTVPVLWDKQTESIVSNESSEIIRMFNTAFNGLTGNHDDYYPAPLRDEIDRINAQVYSDINNGVYKSGFATSQAAYDEAVTALFNSLAWVDGLLQDRRYLAGNQITEADWRLFTTLVRFDAVYHLHFKCNRMRLIDYPNLWPYARELFQVCGVAETVNLEHIVRHYHYSHESINPHRVIPINPVIDWMEPHGRG